MTDTHVPNPNTHDELRAQLEKAAQGVNDAQTFDDLKPALKVMIAAQIALLNPPGYLGL